MRRGTEQKFDHAPVTTARGPGPPVLYVLVQTQNNPALLVEDMLAHTAHHGVLQLRLQQGHKRDSTTERPDSVGIRAHPQSLATLHGPWTRQQPCTQGLQEKPQGARAGGAHGPCATLPVVLLVTVGEAGERSTGSPCSLTGDCSRTSRSECALAAWCIAQMPVCPPATPACDRRAGSAIRCPDSPPEIAILQDFSKHSKGPTCLPEAMRVSDLQTRTAKKVWQISIYT